MKYLLALDDSNISEKAFNWFISIIKPDDFIYILGVAKQIETIYAPSTQILRLNTVARDKMRIIISKFGMKLDDLNITHKCLLGEGNSIAKTICLEAEYYNIDLIVLGRRNRNNNLYSETVSTKVIHKAFCPVLLIKELEEDNTNNTDNTNNNDNKETTNDNITSFEFEDL